MKIYCAQCGRHAVFTRRVRKGGRSVRIWRAHRDGHNLCTGCFRNQRNHVFAVMMAATRIPTHEQVVAAQWAHRILERLEAVEKINGKPLPIFQKIAPELRKLLGFQ